MLNRNIYFSLIEFSLIFSARNPKVYYNNTWYGPDKITENERVENMKYDNNSKFFYKVSNDSSNIYLDLSVNDETIQKMIILNGLNIEISYRGKQAKKIFVKYPLGKDEFKNINFAEKREEMGNVPLMKGRINPEELKLKVASGLNKIEVTELRGKNDPVIYDRRFDKKFFPDIQLDSIGSMVYHVNVPLSFFHQTLGELSGKTFGIKLETGNQGGENMLTGGPYAGNERPEISKGGQPPPGGRPGGHNSGKIPGENMITRDFPVSTRFMIKNIRLAKQDEKI